MFVPPSLNRPMRDRYAAYKRGEVDETTMCGEMVTMHRGVSEERLLSAVARFFDEFFVEQIFPGDARTGTPPCGETGWRRVGRFLPQRMGNSRRNEIFWYTRKSHSCR